MQNKNYLIGKDELNIDYKLNILDKKTWNISLITIMTGPSFNTPYNNTKCITWDLKKEKELNIQEIIADTTNFSLIEKQLYEAAKTKCHNCITNETFKQVFTKDFKNFQITNNNIIFYFNQNILNKYC